jgi:hypothetical protein
MGVCGTHRQQLAAVLQFHFERTAEGAWHVSYMTGGAPGGEAFIQWHSDGTEWENINFPILGGNICMGSWKETDGNHVFRNHFGWLYDTGRW